MDRVQYTQRRRFGCVSSWLMNLRDSHEEENVSVNVFFQYVMTRHPQQANRVAAKIDNLLHSLQIFPYLFNNVEKTKSAHLPQGQVPDIFQLVNVIVSVIVSFLFTKLQRSFLIFEEFSHLTSLTHLIAAEPSVYRT